MADEAPRDRNLEPNERDDETTLKEEPLPESLARGRQSHTPFALLGGVALIAWTAVALVSAVIFVLWYFA